MSTIFRKKIIIALAWNGYHVVHRKEATPIKSPKMYNSTLKSGMCTWYINRTIG